MTRQLIRMFTASALAVVLVLLAAPVFAQTGTLRGRVVNEDGRPVDGVEIILDFVGELKRQIKTITDKNGEWVRAGLPAGGGTWIVTAKKGNLIGTLDKINAIDKITILINVTQKLPEIVLQTLEARAAGKPVPVSMSAEAAAAANKKLAETDKLLAEVNAALSAGNDVEALAKLTALTEKTEKCASCYAKIGEIQVKRNDQAAAEAAFLKAIELDSSLPGPYSNLASIYNLQRKFDEATKMSAKATELGGGAGGENAATIFNEGVIFWNQSKVAEAKAHWAKAVELDPKMADAHYWLGMANLNEGKLPEARAGFEAYLKLTPTGQFADTAKAILATIK